MLVDVGFISGLNTRNVIDMSGLFSHCEQLNSVDFSDVNIENVMYMDGMFAAVSLDKVSYSEILVLFADQNVQNGVEFDGGWSQYTNSGKTARDKLTDDHNWTIHDDGPA
jgi:hypothetical protein